MSAFESDLENMDPMIESTPVTVCDVDILKFEPFKSDLDNAFIDSTVCKTKSTWWEKWLEVSSVIAVNLITLEIFIIIFWLIIFWNNRIYSYLLVFA